jgi:hypothetical protein
MPSKRKKTAETPSESESNIIPMRPIETAEQDEFNETGVTTDLPEPDEAHNVVNNLIQDIENTVLSTHPEDDRYEDGYQDRLLNPNEFKLLKIESKGDRKYRVQFTADDLNVVSTPRIFRGEGLNQHPFEMVLEQIGALLFSLAFSDQKSKNLTLKTLQRVIKQNKNKEPITQYVITAVNVGGKSSYTSVSHPIDLSQLPKEFQPLFNDLENYLREEISRKSPSAEQLGLPFGESEEDEV